MSAPQPGRPITPPPGCDLRVYERYLREKWLCADAIPEVFDPNRLEDRIRASRPSRGGPRENPIANNERQQQQRPLAGRSSSKVEVKKPTLVDLDKPLPSVPCLPTWSQSNGRSAESIASIAKAGDDQLARYASNGAIVETKKTPYARYRADAIIGSGNSPSGVAWAPTAATTTTTTTRDVIERQPTPRIKTGSKPPLSKSAYANASYADSSSRDARGRRPSVSSTARPKAPRYFPFRSQMVAGKK
ncbi:hypothetical protein SLS62_000512 [Diatrype stigma]|uniref:Uncharacterized protein n=1 Tax=Diatrype stigma TaxID=117547 RepID=A0AAN9V1T5_9PEZI